MGVIDRLFGSPTGNGNGHQPPLTAHEVKRLQSSTPTETKALRLSASFIPRDSYGNVIDSAFLFGNSESARVNRVSAYAAAAYCYVAMKYRAEKDAEPPLMVSEESEDGEEWVRGHAIDPLLELPSPDFDMQELRYLTRLYRDMTGMAIWTKDRDRGDRVGRLTPFSADEFTVRPKGGRIYGEFELANVASGERRRRPEDVVFFREVHPGDWWRGLAPVDVALGMLNLGQEVTATAKSLLRNAVLPSLVIQTHQDWNPDQQAWDEWVESVRAQAELARKGEPLALTGGGSATAVSAKIADLVPGELMDRVEATVAAVFGVPAIVLQYLVGMKNSPWSQMEEARRMAYEDTIESLWKRDEKILTRQLLREFDDDPTRYIRIDRSRVSALKADDTKRAAVAASMVKAWTVDEMRIYTGQEPLPEGDDRAGVIPGLQPAPSPFGSAPRPDRQQDEVEEQDESEQAKAWQAKARTLRLAMSDMVRTSQDMALEIATAQLLDADRKAVAQIAQSTLAGTKADRPTQEQRRRFQEALRKYLEEESQAAWLQLMAPILEGLALRSAELVAADVGLSLQMLRDDVLRYAAREVGWLVKEISATTRDAVADALAAGIEAGEGSVDIARRMYDLPAFDRDRARLVARTESTRVMNGAPTEALIARQAETGRRYVKTWFAVLDSRVRDEHADMNGEQQPIDKPFSNGRMYPDEPNCRCTTLTSAVEGL